MPAKSLKKTIGNYCSAHGITVPDGFSRHPASRYAVIRRDEGIPKLVARTWFSQEDVVYYIEHILLPQYGSQPQAFDILDFTDFRRLHYNGGPQLEVLGSFDPEP